MAEQIRLASGAAEAGLSTSYSPNTCSIALMAVQRPNWWCYPERCANGHEWGPGLITVSWMPCECGPAAAAREHGPGHVVVYCEAVKGCRSAWYQPRHAPEHDRAGMAIVTSNYVLHWPHGHARGLPPGGRPAVGRGRGLRGGRVRPVEP